MATKLILTIDTPILEKAEQFAREKNQTVSRIVEDYLYALFREDSHIKSDSVFTSPITDSLVGMFKDPGGDYRELLEDAVTEKYL